DAKPKPNQEPAMPAPGQPPTPPSGPTAAAAATAADPPVDRELDVNEPFAAALAVKEPSASAKVRVKLPASWTASELMIVLRDEFKEAIAGVQFTVICNQGCGDDEIARIPKVVDQMFETKARPNVNTGDAAMDAVRLDVAVVDQGDVPSGKFRVARVT